MVYRVYVLLITGGVLVAAATMPAHAASFDCAKAHKTDEAAICKNPDLSELDTEMGDSGLRIAGFHS
jgi:uncharacterized protein